MSGIPEKQEAEPEERNLGIVNRERWEGHNGPLLSMFQDISGCLKQHSIELYIH